MLITRVLAAVWILASPLVLVGCVPDPPENVDIDGVWHCDNPSGAACVLEVDTDGSLEATGIPRSMLRGFSPSLNWDDLVTASGQWEIAELLVPGPPQFTFQFVLLGDDSGSITHASVDDDGNLLFPVHRSSELYVVFHRAD